MSDDIFKHVYFDNFCSQCINKDTDECESPCNECLSEPAREHSHTPAYFIRRKENEKVL